MAKSKFFTYLEAKGKMPKKKMMHAMDEDEMHAKPGYAYGGKVAPGVGLDEQDDDLEHERMIRELYDDEEPGYNMGGEVMLPEYEQDEMIKKRKAMNYAKGGMVPFAKALRRKGAC